MSAFANSASDAVTAAPAYVQALVDLVGDRDPLALMSEHAGRVQALTRDLDDAALRRPEKEGKWSIIEVVQHLADAELVYAFRLRMILGGDTPDIIGYDQDAWVQRMRYRDADLTEALDVIRVTRNANLRLLRSLTPEERKRGGMHSERGFEDIELLLRLMAGHDIVHGRQIERIRNA
jgi:hypothetical protein